MFLASTFYAATTLPSSAKSTRTSTKDGTFHKSEQIQSSRSFTNKCLPDFITPVAAHFNRSSSSAIAAQKLNLSTTNYVYYIILGILGPKHRCCHLAFWNLWDTHYNVPVQIQLLKVCEFQKVDYFSSENFNNPA